ncbi:E3 ubiquitin-protein ligase HOS1 isoform X2 [Andrographis paniculata]|uniref:E3 ubiquitin-protein ligase HOS1 isoform X2 n=1 Tax=Andrographis paniculata TaxID=175694 RepID=UPI0021E8487A|nr:E3 ubiquitin-protein ligase HOS1 isoform X2 [Andrographis paniculata]
MFGEVAASRSQALMRLASIDPIELCNEAKVELCRATRDLRSCGRRVERVIVSCGHAALCEECSQRCDACPICRVAFPKGGGDHFPLRLYYDCIEAGLLSRKCDDRLQQTEDGDNHLVADVRRLYFLFDAALEHNLVSLICHYVTDVCMDESAASSDPVIAFLLDEKVVQEWCWRTFRSILTELKSIYNLSVQEMKEKLSLLLKISSKLAGISNVLEVLESSFRGTTSPMLHDLSHLQESTLRTKQHLEIMSWCIRHQFLENVISRYSDHSSWNSSVRERKKAAIKRAWPDPVNRKLDSSEQNMSSLFIEDALSNLDSEQGYSDHDAGELVIASLQAAGDQSISRSKLHGMAGCYPFENLRVAADLLFLQGNPDMVVAKQAIFLYFLYDRHWTLPTEDWRRIVDDFAVTFSITRHSLLESLVFYLLDDHTDEALKEAIHLLPEISGPNLHPKVAQALLERENPDSALMALRWSGRDGGTTLVSIREAVTAVRVRLECGLLTEAFIYQRMICARVKENKQTNASAELTEQCNWQVWLEVLVTEICLLCIRRNLTDRMIELPWNSDEEKHIHKCLFDFSMDEPLSTVGSLLAVYYLQRYRYVEAYQVDCQLQSVEEDYIANGQSDEISHKIRSMSHWRKKLVGRSVDLLPDILQQQLKSGNLQEKGDDNNQSTPPKSDPRRVHEPILGNLLFKGAQMQWEENGLAHSLP